MDKGQIFEQMQKRQQLLDSAKSPMLQRSKTGKQDVAIINKVEAIMRSNKPQAQKTAELNKLLKQVQS